LRNAFEPAILSVWEQVTCCSGWFCAAHHHPKTHPDFTPSGKKI